MAIKLDCPRCQKPLSIPRKKIGRYVNCPRCGGRFWVPEKLAEGPGSEAVSTASGTPNSPPLPPSRPSQAPEPLPATISMGSAMTVPPGDLPPRTPEGGNPSPTQDTGMSPVAEGGTSAWRVAPMAAPPAGRSPAVGWGPTSLDPSHPPAPQPVPGLPPPPPGPKTARFVAAEAAQCTLKVAEDGKLPELHLREGRQKDEKEAKTTSVSPWLLLGLLAVSVAICIALVLLDTGPPKSQFNKDRVRREIEERFFPRDQQAPLEYQEYLMKAQRANSQGDLQAERKAYERVLDLLRQERPPYVKDEKQRSVTTSPRGDEDLKRLISILLSSE